MAHTFTTEILHHFLCGSCGKWWSVGDWTPQELVACPHCSTEAKAEPKEPLRLQVFGTGAAAEALVLEAQMHGWAVQRVEPKDKPDASVWSIPPEPVRVIIEPPRWAWSGIEDGGKK